MKHRYYLFALLVIAFGLRLWGISWSLPYVVHPDEPVIVDNVIGMVKRGDLNPNFFQYPSLFFYWQYGVTRLWLLWQQISGANVSIASLPDTSHIYTLTPSLYLWGRAANALLGTINVAIIYLLGRRIFSPTVGLVAALLLTVSPFHTEHSHYITVDVMMWTLACLTLLLAYQFSLGNPHPRRLALAMGLAVGLTTGAKYTGLAVLIPVGIGWLLSLYPQPAHTSTTSEAAAGPPPIVAPRSSSRIGAAINLLIIAVASVVGFLISTPYFIFDQPRFNASFGREADAYGHVRNIGEYWHNISFYITNLWPSEWYIILPGVIGALYLLWRNPRLGLLLTPFPFLYLLALGYLNQTYPRNGFLSVVLLAVPAAYLLDTVARWLWRKQQAISRTTDIALLRSPLVLRHFYASTLIVLVLMLSFVPLRQTVNWDGYMGSRDAALLAQDWMNQQRELGKRFAVELHPWQFSDWPDVIAVYPQGAAQPPLTAQPPSYYATLGYDYAILSSDYDPQRASAAQDYLAQYRALPLVTTFPGDNSGGKGADLSVYRLGDGFAQFANAIPTTVTTTVQFGTIAQLRGYDFGTTSLVPGATLNVKLYFQATHPNGQDLTLFLHLLSADGTIISQIDVATRYGATIPHPTSAWHPGEYILGEYSLPIPATAASGNYRLELGLYDATSGARLALSGTGYAISNNSLVLDGVTIKHKDG